MPRLLGLHVHASLWSANASASVDSTTSTPVNPPKGDTLRQDFAEWIGGHAGKRCVALNNIHKQNAKPRSSAPSVDQRPDGRSLPDDRCFPPRLEGAGGDAPPDLLHSGTRRRRREDSGRAQATVARKRCHECSCGGSWRSLSNSSHTPTPTLLLPLCLRRGGVRRHQRTIP